jgi:Domain of unknown function (DUF4878)
MGKGRFGVVAVAGLLAALALAACGGGSDDNGSSADQDQIKQAITAAATSGDPSACTKYQTAKFTQQTSGNPGQSAEQAVKSCEKDAAETAAEKIDVTDVEVNGDTATAKGTATGSIFDGQTLDVALVKENGQWKLDQFKGFENFDKAAMIASFEKQLAAEKVPQQGIDCLKKQFQAASDQQVEDTFVGNNPQAEDQLFAPCTKYFKQG